MIIKEDDIAAEFIFHVDCGGTTSRGAEKLQDNWKNNLISSFYW
jgi:hypothetical protein